MTKERNIAERDITVATLLSVCRRADTHGATYIGGNDIANLKIRGNATGQALRLRISFHEKSSLPLLHGTRPFSLAAPRCLSAFRTNERTIFTATSEAIDTRAARASIKVRVFHGRSPFYRALQCRAARGATPRSDALS